MGKTAAAKKRPTRAQSDPTQEYLAGLEAKQRFVAAALTMGWRLAVTFLIPVLIGAWLDRTFDSSPSYTITGIFVAIAGSIMVVMNTVKEVNADMAAQKPLKKRGKHAQ